MGAGRAFCPSCVYLIRGARKKARPAHTCCAAYGGKTLHLRKKTMHLRKALDKCREMWQSPRRGRF